MARRGKPNGHGQVGHNSAGTIWLQRLENPVDRDPEIDRLQRLWQKESIGETDLAMLAGLSASTIANLFSGKTRNPRHTTFSKAFDAMGFHYNLVRADKPNYEARIPDARAGFKQYREAMKKKRKARKKK